ncbi:hypothetical protein Tco_0483844 [Tanacetum coccineum]
MIRIRSLRIYIPIFYVRLLIVILGMDWLASHRATIDCYARTVIFGTFHDFSIGCQGFLASVMDTSLESSVSYDTVELKDLTGAVYKRCWRNGLLDLGDLNPYYLIRITAIHLSANSSILALWPLRVLGYALRYELMLLCRVMGFDDHGIIMDPSKVEAITKWPRPTTVTELMRKGEKLCGRMSVRESFEDLKREIVSCSNMIFHQFPTRLDVELCVRGSGGYWASIEGLESNLLLQIKEAQRTTGVVEDRICVPNDQELHEKVILNYQRASGWLQPLENPYDGYGMRFPLDFVTGCLNT